MALAVTSEPAISREALERRRDHLHDRLDTGFRRIDEAQATGRDITDWERLWISLLEEYESVCGQLDAQS